MRGVTEVKMMRNNKLSETQKITNIEKALKSEVNSVLMNACHAMIEKGYNPVNQIVGYIMSGDPTYITGHNNARILISKVERDELLEELVTFYLRHNS